MRVCGWDVISIIKRKPNSCFLSAAIYKGGKCGPIGWPRMCVCYAHTHTYTHSFAVIFGIFFFFSWNFFVVVVCCLLLGASSFVGGWRGFRVLHSSCPSGRNLLKHLFRSRLQGDDKGREKETPTWVVLFALDIKILKKYPEKKDQKQTEKTFKFFFYISCLIQNKKTLSLFLLLCFFFFKCVLNVHMPEILLNIQKGLSIFIRADVTAVFFNTPIRDFSLTLLPTKNKKIKNHFTFFFFFLRHHPTDRAGKRSYL